MENLTHLPSPLDWTHPNGQIPSGYAHLAQLIEHEFCKFDVASLILAVGSTFLPPFLDPSLDPQISTFYPYSLTH